MSFKVAGLAGLARLAIVMVAMAGLWGGDARGGDRVLVIGTNVTEFAGRPSGTFLMEVAIPFDMFRQAGLAVDVVTPAGGAAAFYASGKESAEVQAVAKDPAFLAMMAQSRAPAEVDPAAYAVVLIPGGYAQFVDVLGHAGIAGLVRAVHEAGGIVAGVGHGTAMLTRVTLSDGTPLVAGRTMTAFPWWTETGYMAQSGYGAALPFNMEAELERLGARLQRVPTGDRDALPLVVDRDHRIVTGPYAFNADEVAKAVLDLLAEGRKTP